ncbi:exonuclease SbcCD subunit D C-terminal domain-containing protein [Frankia sp. AiPs1]|uniref:exonuclease SbcCD subunit D n=1 Tax=Frankia sp. AiPs1 TaxID=573493 RepID=UPI00204442D5|nr:exonuclease SbcCD subunit D C-terminal domain-containing protein [Frankia sp. AiPs1]MCM3922562.1 exonuclease SbcCD subunit D C-terminal domain-containing protein [Frankia sp. AiPs1]
MLALHTSDWHLGRGLHGHDLLPAQAAFVDHLVEVVRAESVDVVLVGGDVHDRAIPPVRALELFDEALSRLRDAGTRVVAISGNHDAARRLGDKSGLLDPRIRIRTDPAAVGVPVIVEDADGPVRIYAIPYLEPATAHALLPATQTGRPADANLIGGDLFGGDLSGGDLSGGEQAGLELTGGNPSGAAAYSQAATMRRAMRAVRADLAGHPGARSVVLAHAWVTGGAGSDSERDISVGGIGNVPSSLFDGITYTALGHLHRPQAITPAVRYSGSPLAFSFSEAADRKASLLVDVGRDGVRAVRGVEVPTERRMAVLRGTLHELLTAAPFAAHERDFVSAVLTDPVRPGDAMATLQRRFPHALRLAHEPPAGAADERSFGERTRGRTDLEITTAFVAHVRSDPSPRERALLTEALDAARIAEEAA